ncbi:hypothetical protein A9Q74_01195 [Colwellia sp. 39_35_sub15_T18]|nr:hypothetical protein A9Q74_01195 [Colwellia sp. 39_35_sub15_T18]
MGRAIKFDRDEAIVWVMNEIWRSGFTALSVKAVSEKLGITRSSFYHAFESREALFLEAMNHYFQISPLLKLSTFAESNSALTLLTQVFKETCKQRTDDGQHRGCLAVNSVSELVGVNDSLSSFMANMVNENINGFEALLTYSIHQGELAKSTDTRHLALALQNTLIGLNTMSKVITNEQELWNAIKVILIALNVYRE